MKPVVKEPVGVVWLVVFWLLFPAGSIHQLERSDLVGMKGYDEQHYNFLTNSNQE